MTPRRAAACLVAAALIVAEVPARAELPHRYESQAVVIRTPAPGEPQRWSDFFQGLATPRALRDDALYVALGRTDLAERYRRNLTRNRILVVAGSVLAGLSVIVGTALIFGDGCTYCSNYGAQALGGIGVITVGAGGGLTMLLLGAAMSPHPVTIEEARDLAAERDARLRRTYGVPDPTPAESPPDARTDRPSLRLAPLLIAGGAGAGIVLTF